TPSGLIPKETYDQLKNELLEGIKAETDYDAICLALHGAGVVEGIDDLEGDLLAEVRELVGDKMPIILTLDLHANLTEKMINNADITIGNILYPHEDSYEIAQEAIGLMKEFIDGKIKPTPYIENLPLIIPTFTTELSPMKELNAFCAEMEKRDGVIDCTIYHGFPYTDI